MFSQNSLFIASKCRMSVWNPAYSNPEIKNQFIIELQEQAALTDIVLVFEVHQPHRITKDFFGENKAFKRVPRGKLFEYFFDKELNRGIFE